jgi:periplasmic copper chaperone A
MNRRLRLALAVVAVVAAGGGLLVAAFQPGAGASPSEATPSTRTQVALGSPVATVGAIQVYSPSTRVSLVDASVLYVTIKNSGPAPDKLLAIASDVSSDVAIHEDVTSGLSSTMQLLVSVDVPAHGQVALEPGGKHAMLSNLTRQLAVGDKVHITLTFAGAGTVAFDAPVLGY